MGDFQTMPWTFLLVFLLLPLAFVGMFAWFATSMFKRIGGSQYQASEFDVDGGPQSQPASQYRSRYERDRPMDTSQGSWRSFSFGPGLKTGLIILGVFVLISLIFAPRFLPGVFLFLPLFWVGGWSRTYTPRNSRRYRYPPVEKRAPRERSDL